MPDTHDRRYGSCTIVISGDTALRDNSDLLAKEYGESDLLVLHVGSMEKPGKSLDENHLCFNGVVRVLEAIASNPSRKVPKLVVLTEWGYEFRRPGLEGRTQFTRYAADELNGPRGFNGRFHAAVASDRGELPACPDGAIVLLPADIGLRIQLPRLEVYAESTAGKRTFLDLKRVCARECGESIDYLEV